MAETIKCLKRYFLTKKEAETVPDNEILSYQTTEKQNF